MLNLSIRGQKRVFAIDGTFINGSWNALQGWVLLNVSGMDADGKLVCLGYCLCEKENTASYDKFLGHILEVDIGDGQTLEEYLNHELTVIFSDRQKGQICTYVSVCVSVCNSLLLSFSLSLPLSACWGT